MPLSLPARHRPRESGESVCEALARCGGLYKPSYYHHHTPIEPRLPDKQKAVPRRGGAEAEVTLGVNFGTLLNWLEKKATQYVSANRGKQTGSCSWPAGRLLGGREGRREAGRFPGGARHSSCPRQDRVDGDDVVFVKAGVPETKCLVNTEALDSDQALLLLRFSPCLSFSQ